MSENPVNNDPTAKVLRNTPTRLERVERPAPELTPPSPPAPATPATVETTEENIRRRTENVKHGRIVRHEPGA